MDIEIVRATPEDADEILSLQKTCFMSEAKLYDDYTITPLHETRDEFLMDLARSVILKAVTGGRIIGSVRGTDMGEGKCYIGRLIVHPDRQKRGLGTELMERIIASFPGCGTFELFTGEKSSGNVRLYEKMGFRIEGIKRISDKVNMVRMIKKTVRVPGSPAMEVQDGQR